MPEKCVQGVCLQVPDSFHCLVVHVEYECGHKPQGKGKGAIPATIKLKGEVNPPRRAVRAADPGVVAGLQGGGDEAPDPDGVSPVRDKQFGGSGARHAVLIWP
ncbi:glycosyltransferase family 31 [Apiospora arundinis]